MDNTTLLIIIILVVILLGGGWYGRGRWSRACPHPAPGTFGASGWARVDLG